MHYRQRRNYYCTYIEADLGIGGVTMAQHPVHGQGCWVITASICLCRNAIQFIDFPVETICHIGQDLGYLEVVH
jgi:hypothetical protein